MAKVKEKPLEEVTGSIAGPASDLPLQPETLAPSQALSLVTTHNPKRPLTPHNPDPEGRRRIATSMDLSTKDAQLKAYRAVTGQDLRASDQIAADMDVCDWLMHDIELQNPDTGELQKCVRTVFITPGGERIATVSDGVISSLMSLEHFFGPAPWDPALKLSIKQGRSRHGRTYYFIDVKK